MKGVLLDTDELNSLGDSVPEFVVVSEATWSICTVVDVALETLVFTSSCLRLIITGGGSLDICECLNAIAGGTIGAPVIDHFLLT